MDRLEIGMEALVKGFELLDLRDRYGVYDLIYKRVLLQMHLDWNIYILFKIEGLDDPQSWMPYNHIGFKRS